MEKFWQTCVQRLEQEIPPQQISAWIRPLTPLAFDEAEAILRVGAPNRFKLDWARANFSRRIEDLAAEWYERPVQVRCELDPNARVGPAPVGRPAATPAAGSPAQGGTSTATPATGAGRAPSGAPAHTGQPGAGPTLGGPAPTAASSPFTDG